MDFQISLSMWELHLIRDGLYVRDIAVFTMHEKDTANET